MMTCKELTDLLMAYCDGELPAEHCSLICEHIRLCGPCRNFMESYRITISLSRTLPNAELPQHLVDRLRAALHDGGPGPCDG